MSPRVYRNAPCPCGSGRKYKQCHGRGEGRTRALSLPPWAIAGIVVVVGGAVALLFNTTRNNPARPLPGAALPTAGAGSPATPTPTPYQYDPATNRYWDPSHQHWHDGPPPDSAVRAGGANAKTVTPVTRPPAAPAGAVTDTARR